MNTNFARGCCLVIAAFLIQIQLAESSLQGREQNIAALARSNRAAADSDGGAAAESRDKSFRAQDLAGKRIMVLGDSITQDGRYVSLLEYYLDELYKKDQFDIISIGLASETTSGLTEPGHPFPRPCVHERLERALQKFRPQILFACYGMNDGIYHPQSPERMRAYQDGMMRLIKTAQAQGVMQIVLLTPPVFDATAYPSLMKAGDKWQYFRPYEKYDEVLADYARWIVSLRLTGVTSIDLHTAMATALADRRKKDMNFRFAADGVHPGSLGHLIMARTILGALGIKGFGIHGIDHMTDGNAIPQNALFNLVNERRQLRSEGWLPYIGYTRGETFHRATIDDVEKKARELQDKIDIQRRSEVGSKNDVPAGGDSKSSR